MFRLFPTFSHSFFSFSKVIRPLVAVSEADKAFPLPRKDRKLDANREETPPSSFPISPIRKVKWAADFVTNLGNDLHMEDFEDIKSDENIENCEEEEEEEEEEGEGEEGEEGAEEEQGLEPFLPPSPQSSDLSFLTPVPPLSLTPKNPVLIPPPNSGGSTEPFSRRMSQMHRPLPPVTPTEGEEEDLIPVGEMKDLLGRGFSSIKAKIVSIRSGETERSRSGSPSFQIYDDTLRILENPERIMSFMRTVKVPAHQLIRNNMTERHRNRMETLSHNLPQIKEVMSKMCPDPISVDQFWYILFRLSNQIDEDGFNYAESLTAARDDIKFRLFNM